MQTQALCRQAAEVLAGRLVERFPEVQAVVLYGSVARGEAHEDSDVDLLAVVSTDADTLRNPIFDLGQELLADFPHVMTQVIVEETEEFRRRAIEGYSLERTVARQGVALYDTGVFAAVREDLPPRIAEQSAEYAPTPDLMREHMRAAEEALAAARLLFDNQFWDDVSNRAYYAMFNAATAAVIKRELGIGSP
jgi:predicted nucleotidyltransferase